MRLSAPEAVQAGAQLSVVAEVGGRGRHDGGQLEVQYDANRLEAVGLAGSAPGSGTLSLPAGLLPGVQSLVFRVKPDAQGAATVSIKSVILDSGGQQLATPAGASATIPVRP